MGTEEVEEDEEAIREGLEEAEKVVQGVEGRVKIRVGRRTHCFQPSINPAKTGSKMMALKRVLRNGKRRSES